MNSILLATLLLTSVVLASATGVPGGWSPVDSSSPDYNTMVKLSAEHITNASNSIYHTKPTTVREVKRQVVAGLKYSVTIEMGETVCKKLQVDSDKVADCDLKQNVSIANC